MTRTSLLAALLTTAAIVPVSAEPIPWSGSEVELVARNRPLTDFLRDLFAAEDLNVSFSSAVSGQLNGEFAGDAGDVFARVAAAYGLVPYYDGGTVRIYAGSEVGNRMYNLAPDLSAEVRRTLRELALGDERNTTRITSDGVLVATGVPRYLDAVDGVVTARGLARAEDGGAMTFEVFPLRYAWAQDTTSRFGSTEVMVPGVASIVRGLVATGPSTPVEITRTRAARSSVAGMRDRYRDTGVMDIALQPEELGVRPREADEGEETRETLPPLPPGVRVEADPRLNAVIVRDRPERMAIYRSLIEELDKEPQIVAIEATIVDVDTDKLRDIGVQWRYGTEDADVTLGGRQTEGLPLSPGDFLNPFNRGLLASGVVGDRNRLTARIAALESEGLARVVSSPQVMTLANVEAVFNNTRTFYVRVASRFDAELFDVTVGTSLSVTPHVVEEDGERLVKLLVRVEDGQLTPGSVDDIPIVETSGVGTQALMRHGQSLLLGGLTVDRSESFEEGVPILRSIPILGRAFKSTSKRSGHVERMFLLTPRLANAGGNLAVNLDEPTAAPAPQAPPALPDRNDLAAEVSLSYDLPAPYDGAPVAAAAGTQVALDAGPPPLPLLRGGQLFSSACDDLDPFATCGSVQ